jgi:phosphoglycerol transferase
VTEFVEWCRQQEFYEDTVIVITGDHPRMDTYLVNGISYYNRTVYNCFINSEITAEQDVKSRTFTPVDMFPTVLRALGFQIEGDRLGLGVDLFSSKKTLAERKGIEWMNQEISKSSDYYVSRFAPNIDLDEEGQ